MLLSLFNQRLKEWCVFYPRLTNPIQFLRAPPSSTPLSLGYQCGHLNNGANGGHIVRNNGVIRLGRREPNKFLGRDRRQFEEWRVGNG